VLGQCGALALLNLSFKEQTELQHSVPPGGAAGLICVFSDDGSYV
jgi:hypothetical protein